MQLNLKTFIPLVVIFALQISIIVPIYQVEAYLEECLQSLLDQTYKNLDIVLINDGSIDKSLDIAMHYVRLDQRLFLITKPNGGLSSARNMGLELINGTGLRNLLESCEFDSSHSLKNLDSLESFRNLEGLNANDTKDKCGGIPSRSCLYKYS